MGVQGHPDIFVTRQQDGNMDDKDDDKYDKDKSVVALVVSPKSSQTRIGLNSSSIFGTWVAQQLNPYHQCLAALSLKSSLGQVWTVTHQENPWP